MNEKTVYNFKETEPSKDMQYLRPGTYRLTIQNAVYTKPNGQKPDGSPKTPFLEITFVGDSGQMSSKFYITPKAIERLQTFFTNWFDQKLDKVFDSTDAVGAFLEKAFTSEKAKKTFKRMVISGRQVGDKVYADLPFKGYIVPDTIEDWKEGPFEKGSAEWVYWVRVEANASTGSSDVMLSVPTSAKADFPDDLPF